MYRENCIEFDHIFGWDAKPIRNWLERVPAEDRLRVTFYNEYINATDSSALGVLKRTARPEDFVVLKVDFDDADVEAQVLDAIRRPAGELAALVDEMFVEFSLHPSEMQHNPAVVSEDCHKMEGCDSAAHTIPAKAKQALGLMRDLRELGIRAHFWI